MKETIIYIRTSTEEQNPKNQLEDCKKLAEKLDLKDYEILEERKSAFKDNVKREIFNSIKKAIQKGEVKNLIVWDLDRLYRNRKKLIGFFELCNAFKCKIYSFRQAFLNAFDNLNLPQGFEFLAEMYRRNFLQFLGWISEEESVKKSERVKASVRKKEGKPTKSYKGNIWGRKALSKKTIQEVLDLCKKGLSIRQIADQVYYWDSNNNKRKISKSAVHKIINENIPKKS